MRDKAVSKFISDAWLHASFEVIAPSKKGEGLKLACISVVLYARYLLANYFLVKLTVK